MKVARRSVASQTDESAELKRQLDVADANIALVNKRLDEAQGMFQRHLIGKPSPLGPNRRHIIPGVMILCALSLVMTHRVSGATIYTWRI